MSDEEAPKLTDLKRMITTPAVIQINEDGERRSALFLNMVTSDGNITFCFSPEEIHKFIVQLQNAEAAVLHTKAQMDAVDWDSLRPEEETP